MSLAEDAHRVENGIPTGSSGEGIRRQLENGPPYRVVMAIRVRHSAGVVSTVKVALARTP
ncbi:MAG TPA: hypothetical protein VJT49_03925 [Amycolatopsis sp.]|uniref:hypothetical protein n=1 Tax=Amycolatopsis sp. TaxID=37632 RepID=UPI002B49B0B3|nr:hypothetical protein [Amycolatopsis sp.]HKS44259.1 hypothetical protein [Amycolatopsis sp.]